MFKSTARCSCASKLLHHLERGLRKAEVKLVKVSHIQRIQSVQKYQHNHDCPVGTAKSQSKKKEDQVQISEKAKELLHHAEAAKHSQKIDPTANAKVRGDASLQLNEKVQGAEAVQSHAVQETAVKDPHRMEKLQRLKQEIDAGTYKVDARKLAEKMLPYMFRDDK